RPAIGPKGSTRRANVSVAPAGVALLWGGLEYASTFDDRAIPVIRKAGARTVHWVLQRGLRVAAIALLGAALVGVLTVSSARPRTVGVAPSKSVEADGLLTFETEDWRFEAPDVLGTQADLELNGRQTQLCTDEIKRLIHHRPTNVPRFTWRWSIGGGPGSNASPVGVETRFPDQSYRLVDPATRSFREDVRPRSVCYGPHEVTHVLTWESWQLAWANEGFATFMEWLYDSGSWRYGSPVQLLPRHDCDENGYIDGPQRHPFSDLRQFHITYEMYATA